MEEDNNLEERTITSEFSYVGCKLPHDMFVKFRKKLVEEGLSVREGIAALIENYLNAGND